MFSWRGVSPRCAHMAAAVPAAIPISIILPMDLPAQCPRKVAEPQRPGNQQAVDAAGQHGAIGIGKARLHAADKQLIAVDMAVFAATLSENAGPC